MKMLKNKIALIAFFTFLLTMVSCKKYLDLEPQDGITRQDFWKTKEQVGAAVTGCYSSLLSGVDRPLVEFLFLWGELRADMLATTAFTRAEETDIIAVNILPTNPIVNWRTIYRSINYCNTVIAFAPQVLENDQTYTQEALNAHLAEVKTLRALLYFYLARTFGEVPLKLTATTSDEEIEQLPKSSKEEVLNQIVKDLSEAEPNAVTTYGSQFIDKGRITRYTVNALQADVFLWMEKYQESVAACDKIINSRRFGLISGDNPGAWFNTLYVNGNSSESIFEFQFDNLQNPFFGIHLAGNKRFSASPSVMDEMYTVDFTNDLNKDIRGDGAAVRSSDGTIWKYAGLSATTARASDNFFANWIVYRYADVLLMKAEALNQLGKGQEALDLVKVIRDRARALAATQRSPVATDKDGIADYILEERAREFAFEGKRWYDLLRNAKRDNYRRKQILLDLVTKTAPPDRQQSAIAKFKDPNSHYLPIFAYELQTDKQLVQNPFYK